MACYGRVNCFGEGFGGADAGESWQRTAQVGSTRGYDWRVSSSDVPVPVPDAPARPGIGRRLVGIGIDWTLSLVISSAFFANTALAASAGPLERVFLVGNSLATLVIWAVQHLLLVSTLGTTIGHRIVGAKVVREDGSSPVGLLGGAIRTVTLVLVIPALFTDEDGRGYHDRAAHTRLIRTR